MTDETSEVELAAIDAELRGMTGAEQVRLIATLRAEVEALRAELHKVGSHLDIQHAPDGINEPRTWSDAINFEVDRRAHERMRDDRTKHRLAIAERDRTIGELERHVAELEQNK